MKRPRDHLTKAATMGLAYGTGKTGMPLPYAADILSRCMDTLNDGDRCPAVMLTDGETRDTCGEPCSFCLRKAGSGDPPFLHESDLVEEMEKLMLRRSRGTLRR